MYYVFWYTCILNMEHSGVLFIPIIQQIIKIYLTELKRYITISAYSITQSEYVSIQNRTPCKSIQRGKEIKAR